MKKLIIYIIPYIILWYLLGSLYLSIEGIWRGWTHISMLVVGGICGLSIGAINQIPKFYKLRIIWQCLIGTGIILLIEFISGCILNLWLGLGIWDYSSMLLNLKGQICLLYGVIWFFLIPFAIWAEDKFRWLLYWYYDTKGVNVIIPPYEDYTLFSIYKDLVTGK